MEKEIWKQVVGYEGLYEVSNLGNVKHVLNGFVLKPSKQTIVSRSTSYHRFRVSLWKNSIGVQFKIHRLVAQAFIPNPENKPQVNHIDNDSLNNKVDNLEWVTNKENSHHAMRQGRINRGSCNGMSKLKEIDVVNIRNSIETKNKIMSQYSISRSYLNQLLRGDAWKHLYKGITYKD